MAERRTIQTFGYACISMVAYWVPVYSIGGKMERLIYSARLALKLRMAILRQGRFLDVPRKLKGLLDKAARCGTSDEDFEIVRPKIEEICQDTG